jgi:hypothetical protein
MCSDRSSKYMQFIRHCEHFLYFSVFMFEPLKIGIEFDPGILINIPT